MLTFKQAFDRLTEAYVNGKVNPLDGRFCFCGNLENNTQDWHRWLRCSYMHMVDTANIHYTLNQYNEMEQAFMAPISDFLFENNVGTMKLWIDNYNDSDKIIEEYENALWKGFIDALEVLKRIHVKRGEKIEEFEFSKRLNKPVCAL